MPRTGLTAEEIKDKTIEAALIKMREVGFEKVRLTDIAKELKVSHAALYAHFKDRSELLDAVTERWLLKTEEKLESICRKQKDPCEKIYDWVLALHRIKVEKVNRDPQPYKAFDMAAEQLKPFVVRHLETLHRQLLSLVTESAAKRRLRNADLESMTKIISSALVGFHHPRMVAQYIDEKRENLLREVIDSVLKGLKLKK